ncbi:TrsK protein [Desulfocucumis palustris]|uniref:TrsK protein n=1 Tax=Desulfocucumis palustris TaxID=1898651 RepID=A0A2L2XGT5_9FIRM|nr:hypothetical protein [Desulfocucumis palustris]GBF35415.1 TrsK protein [Desulfocucumis palustris]
MKFRLYLVLTLVLLDLFLLPPVLHMPNHWKAYGFKAGAVQWKQEFLGRPWEGPMILVADEKVRTAWCWAQLIMGAAVVNIFQKGRRRSGKKGDGPGGPPAAGDGQFGTSRWQTEKEIKSNFKMVSFSFKGIKSRGKS